MEKSLTTEQVWELLSDRLRGFLRARVSDPSTAEDLLQETFLRIHQKLDSLQDQDRLTSWVYQVARNLVNDYYRKTGRDSEVELVEER